MRGAPVYRFLVVYRVGSWARRGSPLRVPARLVCRILNSRMTIRYGIEIPFRTEVGPGLLIAHRIGGVIVHPDAVIGCGVSLSPGVVVGNNGARNAAPTIGDGVVITVGAKVLGAVSVGAGTLIGANSVVTKDIPAGVVAAGAPARVLEGRAPRPSAGIDFRTVLGPVPERG